MFKQCGCVSRAFDSFSLDIKQDPFSLGSQEKKKKKHLTCLHQMTTRHFTSLLPHVFFCSALFNPNRHHTFCFWDVIKSHDVSVGFTFVLEIRLNVCSCDRSRWLGVCFNLTKHSKCERTLKSDIFK